MKIDGRKIADQILEELKTKVKKLKEKNITPNLAIILVGDDPASKAYVKQKQLQGEKIGAKITIKNLPSQVSLSFLISAVKQYNDSKTIHGIVVQQPLSSHINSYAVTQAIDPRKDVDGFHAKSKFEPPIALAVLKILKEVYEQGGKRGVTRLEGLPTPLRQGFAGREQRLNWRACPPKHERRREGKSGQDPEPWLKSKNILVLGKGKTGGEPVTGMLRKIGIQPKVIDSKTKNPEILTGKADIVISAVGKPNVLKLNMIKKGAVLISIGLHKEADGKLHGDYEEDQIKNKASFYTPSPGGVGPVNVAMLLKNLITASEIFSH